MKKLAAILLGTLSCLSAYALPLGNPAEPRLFPKNECGCSSFFSSCGPGFECLSFGVGYYGDFVYDRFLGSSLGRISKTRIWTNAGYLVLNICDAVDIFSTLGGSRLKLEGFGKAFGAHSPSAIPAEPRFVTLESKFDFSWSIGARAAIWEFWCFGIGVEGQYFRFNPNVNFISDVQTSLAYPDTRIRYSEWQLGAGAYYRLECEDCWFSSAMPYVGIKWSRAHLDFRNSIISIPDSGSIDTFNLHNLRSKKHVGVAFGSQIVFCSQVGVTVEGRLGNEIAFYVNGEYRF